MLYRGQNTYNHDYQIIYNRKNFWGVVEGRGTAKKAEKAEKAEKGKMGQYRGKEQFCAIPGGSHYVVLDGDCRILGM